MDYWSTSDMFTTHEWSLIKFCQVMNGRNKIPIAVHSIIVLKQLLLWCIVLVDKILNPASKISFLSDFILSYLWNEMTLVFLVVFLPRFLIHVHSRTHIRMNTHTHQLNVTARYIIQLCSFSIDYLSICTVCHPTFQSDMHLGRK